MISTLSRAGHLLSRLLLPLGLVFALGLASPQAISAQEGADANETMDFLKNEAMGAVKGCDYTKYLRLAENVVENWDSFKSFTENVEPDKEWWVPFTDYVSMLFNAGSAKASAEAAEAEKESLIYTLEQVCNSAVQADELNRVHDIVEAGSLNIGNAVSFLLDETGFAVDLTDGEPRLEADYATLYENLVPSTSSRQDTLYSAINQSIDGSLQASNDMSDALDRLSEDLTRLRRELVLVAEHDTVDDEGFMCPEGYPDPDEEDLRTDDETGRPICGPAPPERSAQVMAHLEALKTQIQAVGMSADARVLELETVRLMADNHLRRVEHYTDMQSLSGF